jgi:predicted GIY-YIG superfamily endonuclease
MAGEGWQCTRKLGAGKQGYPLVYVYILRSVEHSDRYYVGVTADLRERLKRHNAGEVAHTSKYTPWSVKTYIAFSDETQAFAFERYLKSPSGRAFTKKRL